MSDVAHLAELFGGNAQLGVDLVDDGARAAGALVVHRRNFLLAAGVRSSLKMMILASCPPSSTTEPHAG